MKYVFNKINEHFERTFESAIPQGFSSTICKLHCGVCGVSYAGFSQHRSVLPDRNELRNPQRQLTSDRYAHY
ncbi:hypothetical protein [Tangfeifania diversioriginum]|uniref:hypothetical protein n=1 Tax=Tangfeifania diversioriginum TaxID=1168035 RepID=UPI001587BC04|nr:hypothetical protein [Tangfeifania diversioriginum]